MVNLDPQNIYRATLTRVIPNFTQIKMTKTKHRTNNICKPKYKILKYICIFTKFITG